ncbi:MAG: hypothetical protein ACRDTV_09430 [Mycobacterium sp.]
MTSSEGDTAPESPTLELAEAAEAEAAAAEAEARAAAARTRAIRLRQQSAATPVLGRPPVGSSRRRRRSTRMAVAAGAAIVVIGALLASGYMVWQDRVVSQQRQRAAEYATAAREGVVALMSLDFSKPQEGMQRIADISTGNVKNSFPVIAEQLTKGLQQSQVTTTVTVHDIAVESMTDNSAIVLVAATMEAKAPDGPPQPRSWQVALGLRMEGGKPKMANIEFVQ